jgi:hypothetical protein
MGGRPPTKGPGVAAPPPKGLANPPACPSRGGAATPRAIEGGQRGIYLMGFGGGYGFRGWLGHPDSYRGWLHHPQRTTTRFFGGGAATPSACCGWLATHLIFFFF